MRRLLVVLAAITTATPACALERWIDVVNVGRSAIQSVLISNVDTPNFGQDLLGSYQIAPGNEMRVEPDVHSGYCRYDVLVTYETGEEVRLWDVNLCEATSIVVEESNWDVQYIDETTSSDVIRTSRIFLPPHNFPPEEFSAYGIVAFPTLSDAENEARYIMVCRAYLATLPEAEALATSTTLPATPLRLQMATVWPVDAEGIAKVRDENSDSLCSDAVRHYHLQTALIALRQAAKGGSSVGGRGPYLLAWSPSSQKGKRDAVVLVADLSSATTYEQFRGYFRDWRRDIEQNPDLWRNGWSMEKVRLAIRNWADRWGSAILSTASGAE